MSRQTGRQAAGAGKPDQKELQDEALDGVTGGTAEHMEQDGEEGMSYREKEGMAYREKQGNIPLEPLKPIVK